MPFLIQQTENGVMLAVKLQPRSSKNEIGECANGVLKIRVTAPPVDSAANNALIAFLSEVLDCPKSAIQLVRGKTSRHKALAITGITVADASKRLGLEL